MEDKAITTAVETAEHIGEAAAKAANEQMAIAFGIGIAVGAAGAYVVPKVGRWITSKFDKKKPIEVKAEEIVEVEE